MEGQPRICDVCGEAIILGKQSVWFKTSEPKKTWHYRCRPSVAELKLQLSAERKPVAP